MICDGCGREVDRIHDIETRVVRDLPVLDAVSWVSVPRRRVSCPHCGPRLERLEWLDRHSRVTRRLAESVVRLCRVLPVKLLSGVEKCPSYRGWMRPKLTHPACSSGCPDERLTGWVGDADRGDDRAYPS
ncbi:transposase family protein [Nitrospirillum viridazoti]|uniref:transposase family protein n=1 Tax=Nitrospirillum viridazoti TaxID=3144925 RepID=UPI0009D9C0EC